MRRLVLFLLALLFLGTAAAVGAGALLYMWAVRDLPSFTQLADYRPPLASTVFARDGRVLGYLAHEKRFLVTLPDLPSYVPQAFMAAEDAGFYHHEGVDPMAILRAFLANLRAGGLRQGGSTITQQLIKQLLLTPEKSFGRKVKEAILAYRLERFLTKDEILTIYINQIYLGSSAYGVEAAARIYFGKHAKELTLAEAAVLGGLPQAPSSYNPYQHYDAALHRQKYVLSRMYESGFINQEQLETAQRQKIVLRNMSDPSWGVGAYYLEEVRRQLVDKFGEKAVYEGGLQVHTAVDLEHQAAAEAALHRGLAESSKRRGWAGPVDRLKPGGMGGFLALDSQPPEALGKGKWVKVAIETASKDGLTVRFGAFHGRIQAKDLAWARKVDTSKLPSGSSAGSEALAPGMVVWASVLERPADPKNGTWTLALERDPEVEGALVSMRTEDGDVLALVGGSSFQRSQFNRATQARRQPGSSFKPVVYSAALDNGFTAASVVLDAPVVFANSGGDYWKPENFEGDFQGPIILRTALVKSRNLVTVRVAQKIGVKAILDRAHALGLNNNLPAELSVALGSGVVTPIEMVQAYSAFARGGSRVKPRLITEVDDSWGRKLLSVEPESVEAITPQNAFIMCSMLKDVVTYGTGTRARLPDRPVAGKTGTSNDERDAWFIGFTPALVTGIYVGFDSNEPMGRGETGGRAAAPIFADYRLEVDKGLPPQDFEQPEGITMLRVDGESGTLAGPESRQVLVLPFMEGTEPAAAPAQESTGSGNEPAAEDLFKQVY